MLKKVEIIRLFMYNIENGFLCPFVSFCVGTQEILIAKNKYFSCNIYVIAIKKIFEEVELCLVKK